MSFRCQMFFSSGRNGWEEIVYSSHTSITALRPSLHALARSRASLLGRGAQVVALRMRSLDGTPWTWGEATAYESEFEEPAVSHHAILAHLEAGGASRGLLLRGVPRGLVRASSSAGALLSSGLQAAFDTYVGTLTNGHWAMLCRERKDQYFAVDAATWDAPGGVLVLHLAGRNDFQPGDIVTLSHMRFSGRPSGDTVDPNSRYEVLSNDLGLVWLDAPGPFTGQWVSGGQIRRYGTVIRPITRLIGLRSDRRRTGPARMSPGQTPPKVGPVVVGDLPPPPPVSPPATGGLLGPLLEPIPVVGAGDATLNTARDLAASVFLNYDNNAISTSKILNYKDTYLLEISGTQFAFGTATAGVEDIEAAVRLVTPYQKPLVAAVLREFPPGSIIILAGHSLGGMIAERTVERLRELGYRVHTVVTFGSPWTTFRDQSARYVRFMAIGDPVPTFSPLNLLQGFSQIATYTFVNPRETELSPGKQHSSYATDPAFADYDALGFFRPAQPIFLQRGPKTYWRVTVPV